VILYIEQFFFYSHATDCIHARDVRARSFEIIIKKRLRVRYRVSSTLSPPPPPDKRSANDKSGKKDLIVNKRERVDKLAHCCRKITPFPRLISLSLSPPPPVLFFFSSLVYDAFVTGALFCQNGEYRPRKTFLGAHCVTGTMNRRRFAEAIYLARLAKSKC